jgi:hypothetical protein
MLLQTNSYIVPKEKRAEHSRLIRRFRQTLLRLGCDHFEVYEQVGSNWSNSESAGRYVQILRFLDRKHQLAVQSAERTDPTAQAVIADFCDLINFPYQQQQGLFAVGFYTSVLPVAPKRGTRGELVSTVEHEVIDDPEAEKPYPGSSDGPPLEEAAMAENTEHAAEPMIEEPAGESEHAFHEPLEEPTAELEETFGELVQEPAAEVEEPKTEPVAGHHEELLEEAVEEQPEIVSELPTEAAVETGPFAAEPAIPEVATHTDSNDDFMDLISGDMAEARDLLEEDDSANGFLEVDFSDDTVAGTHVNGVQPGQPHTAEHSAEHHEST